MIATTNSCGRETVELLEDRRLLSAYVMADLGSLSGYSDSTATGLNAYGTVVGYVGHADPYYEIGSARAFMSKSGGKMQSIAGRGSIATGINDAGKIVGADVVAGQTRPFVADPNSKIFTDLGTAITGPQFDDGEPLLPIPHAINNAGQIAGETIYAYTGDQLAWVFTPSSKIGSVRVVAGDTNAAALAINDSGVSTGYSGSVIGAHAFRNSGGDPANLGMLPEAQVWASSRGLGINNAGQIVGDSSADADGSITHAIFTTGGAMHDLGTLPGQTDSTADDISNQGIIVGQSGGRAFVFRNGKMTDLNTLISGIKGLVLTDAVAINDNGQIAVNGTLNGHTHAFLLTPTAQAAISGWAFQDLNGDGVRQASEPLLRGRQIYVDANRNGRYDVGEQTILTNKDGWYRLKAVAAGTSRISQVLPSGWKATAVRRVTSGSATPRTTADITVSAMGKISNIDFGSRRS